ncbi:MAG: hypothetical protein GY915_09450 [bacterium]|nr:hypothetical protein [bacterium]
MLILNYTSHIDQNATDFDVSFCGQASTFLFPFHCENLEVRSSALAAVKAAKVDMMPTADGEADFAISCPQRTQNFPALTLLPQDPQKFTSILSKKVMHLNRFSH